MMTTNDGMGIPVSRRATCVYCGLIIDTNANGVFELATGWLMNRPKGAASPALAKRHHKFACHECIERLRHNINPLQSSLFNIDLGDYAGDL